MQTKKALGVDIGNVIINTRLLDPEIKKVDEATYAAFPASDGVFDALRTLNDHFHGQVFLVSKCTEWGQVQILLWLKAHDFYSKTGINESHVHFVRERHEKDAVCQKLGITHFIDDRLEVLSHMVNSTPNLILFQPDPAEIKEFESFLPIVFVANDWSEVLEKVTK